MLISDTSIKFSDSLSLANLFSSLPPGIAQMLPILWSVFTRMMEWTAAAPEHTDTDDDDDIGDSGELDETFYPSDEEEEEEEAGLFGFTLCI